MTEQVAAVTALSPFFHGFLTNLGMIAAIGVLNAYLLRRALQGRPIALTIVFFSMGDSIFIVLGVAGFGEILFQHKSWMVWGLLAGITFILLYSINLIRQPVSEISTSTCRQENERLWKQILFLSALYFLNPQAFIEVVVILGTIAGQYEDNGRLAFGAGCLSSSWGWFAGFGLAGKYFSTQLTSLKAQRWLNRATIVILLGVAGCMVMKVVQLVDIDRVSWPCGFGFGITSCAQGSCDSRFKKAGYGINGKAIFHNYS